VRIVPHPAWTSCVLRPASCVLRQQCIGALAILISLATSGGAQETRWWQPEVRADAILARTNTYHGAVGVSTPMGNYIRVAMVGGGGVTVAKGESVASGRIDLIGRFLIDPFRQSKRGPYAGAGVSWRAERGETGRAYVVVMLGFEGNPGPRFVPAMELGLGGGTRVGLVLRRSVRDRR
jgi:hypothetical protein